MEENVNVDSLKSITKRLLFLLKRKIKTFFLTIIPRILRRIVLKPGVSFIIRAKNEEENIKNCIMSIIDIADEIIFVDNLSTDNTLDIVQSLRNQYPNIIKIYQYKIKIPKCGEEQENNVKIHSHNTIAKYYNWCLNKSKRYNIIKWDADCIANKENLQELVSVYNLHNRSDKFSLWFTGQTVFLDEDGDYYLNEDSFYDEFRCYSKLNGFHWIDTYKWEAPSPNYVETSFKEKFEKPCFYEMKAVGKRELSSSRSKGKPLDSRDEKDLKLLKSLKEKGNTKLRKIPFDFLATNIRGYYKLHSEKEKHLTKKIKILIYTDSRGQDMLKDFSFKFYPEKLEEKYFVDKVLCPHKWTTTLDFLEFYEKAGLSNYDLIILHTGIVDHSPRHREIAIKRIYKSKKYIFDKTFGKANMKTHLRSDLGVVYEGDKTINMYSKKMAKLFLLPKLKEIKNLVWISHNKIVSDWNGNYWKDRPKNIHIIEEYAKLFLQELGKENCIDLMSWSNDEIKKYTLDNMHLTKIGSDYVYKEIVKKIDNQESNARKRIN